MGRHLHGRYTILGKLADGGMAEIFLAIQHGAEGFQKNVVLKRILTQYSADPQFRNMLLDEAHISMSLQHSNVVQVLDLGEAVGRYFLVLELVDGWDLERILQRAQASSLIWPPALALFVTTQVCRALAYAHNKTRDGKPLEIVHRDISPNNVLISEQGEVKLADFGIAKAGHKREQTAAGVIKGKVAYMSPEQALGGSGIDRRSDIFSVGSMLYRMMTDKLPFDAGNDLESLLRVQKAQFAPPEDAKPTVGSAVSSIIMRAMRLAPSERYQTADEMLADVERVLRNDFQSAGQTELKLWLEQLSRRDEAMPIGKRRLDTSGIVKDVLGTDLSAGTSFELDDLERLTTGETEISTSPPTPPPSALLGGSPAAGAAKGPPPLPRGAKPRRRIRTFWLGSVFALGVGAVLGIQYFVGWARDRGVAQDVADKLGLGPDGSVRRLVGTVEQGPAPEGAAPPAPVGAPAAPVGAPAAPVAAPPQPGPAPPSPSAAAIPLPPAPVIPEAAPPAPPAPVAAAKDAGAAPLAVNEPARQVAAPEPAPPGEGPPGDDEPDEEALLKNAVANPESEVIGEDEAEPVVEEAPRPVPGATPAKRPAPTKTAARTPPPRPAPSPSTKPAAPKTETIVLRLKSHPVGAVVRVKSRVLGRTPISLHFKSDRTYEITFIKRGYVSTTKKVSLTGGKDRNLAVGLRKRPPPPKPKKRSFFHPHR